MFMKKDRSSRSGRYIDKISDELPGIRKKSFILLFAGREIIICGTACSGLYWLNRVLWGGYKAV